MQELFELSALSLDPRGAANQGAPPAQSGEERPTEHAEPWEPPVRSAAGRAFLDVPPEVDLEPLDLPEQSVQPETTLAADEMLSYKNQRRLTIAACRGHITLAYQLTYVDRRLTARRTPSGCRPTPRLRGDPRPQVPALHTA